MCMRKPKAEVQEGREGNRKETPEVEFRRISGAGGGKETVGAPEKPSERWGGRCLFQCHVPRVSLGDCPSTVSRPSALTTLHSHNFFFPFAPFDPSKSFTYPSPLDCKLLEARDLCLISHSPGTCRCTLSVQCMNEQAGKHRITRAKEEETSRTVSDMTEAQGEG